MEKKNFEVTVFIGSLSLSKDLSHAAYSEAGMQVQLEIIRLLNEKSTEKVDVISLNPLSAFPNGKLFNRFEKNEMAYFLPFINIPILKHITFSACLLWFLFKLAPNKIIIYNSYFFQNIALSIYKAFHSKVKIALLIQDVLSVGTGLQSVQKYLDRKSLRWLSFCDLVVPISRHIVPDFDINVPSVVVQGGVTKRILDHFPAMEIVKPKIRRVVFAGSLEPHNGVHLLVDQWDAQGIQTDLHIFGKGSLKERVMNSARTNPRIHYHGVAPHSEVQQYISESMFILILRFELGIETKYFFPSKFWEAIASNSHIICNQFDSFPDDLKKYCVMLSPDFSNLNMIDRFSNDDIDQVVERRKYVEEHHTWKQRIDMIIEKLCN